MIENKSLKDMIKFRMDKISRLKEKGVDLYPHKYERSHKNIEIHNSKNNLIDDIVSIAGRVVSLRNMGKSSFLNIQDDTSKIQHVNNPS